MYTMHGLGSASPPVAAMSASGELETPEPATYLLVKLVSILSLLWITTVTSDSRSLAIPCFALAPNRLMLAVVIFPLGSITVLANAATLSRAHLIQPSRALGAEPQVRSSSRESLQLYMRLRVAPQSSTPRMRTDVGGGHATARRRRRSVGAETSIPSDGATRSLTSALVAKPSAGSRIA